MILVTGATGHAAAVYSFFAEGTIDESTVRSTVEDLTARPPHTLAQWAAAHADELGAAPARHRTGP